MAQNPEWCGNCGRPRPLLEVSGFCLECSRTILNLPFLSICVKCDNLFDGRKQVRKTCQRCEHESWLGINADKIESYMRAGLPFGFAAIKVAFDNRPQCMICGEKIKGGREGWHLFCRDNVECRRAARRFKYYRLKGKTRENALKEALRYNERAA